MIAIIIKKDESTYSFNDLISHSFNNKDNKIVLEHNSGTITFTDIKHYAIFSDNGAELLKVTLKD